MVADWLHLHALNADMIDDCVNCIRRGDLHLDLEGHAADRPSAHDTAYATLDHVLGSVICPMFATGLEIDADTISGIVRSIRWGDIEKGGLPHTIDHGVGHSPEVKMSWSRSTSDLICLAHEVAHAVQLQLSAGSFMPPVARETCAFLGELILISWATKNNPDLAAKLLVVWREENCRYFGEDCDLLISALTDAGSQYSYRMNYPLARAAAVIMWRSGENLGSLFRSGSAAMNFLPFAQIADLAGNARNYLPPMPQRDSERPALSAYRAFGAVALLDIDFWKGESERRIDEYYTSLIGHWDDGTVFVELDVARRPIGYATWHRAGDENTVVLTRQAAPFGDHLALQKALEHHMGLGGSVRAHHPRSARSEQVAW